MIYMAKLNRTHAIIIAAVAAVCVVVAVVVVGNAQTGGNTDSPSESAPEQHEMGLQDYLDLGNQRLADLDFEGAVLAFRNAIQIDPNSQDAITGLTTAYYQWAGSETRSGNYSHALEILSDASADLPDDPQFTQLAEVVSLSSTLHGSTDQYAAGFSDDYVNGLNNMAYDSEDLPTVSIYNALAQTSDQSGNAYSTDLFDLCNSNGGKYVLEPFGLGIYRWHYAESEFSFYGIYLGGYDENGQRSDENATWITCFSVDGAELTEVICVDYVPFANDKPNGPFHTVALDHALYMSEVAGGVTCILTGNVVDGLYDGTIDEWNQAGGNGVTQTFVFDHGTGVSGTGTFHYDTDQTYDRTADVQQMSNMGMYGFDDAVYDY